MLELRYRQDKTSYEIEFKKIRSNVVQIIGALPIKGSGFTLSRPGQGDKWDYTDFKTVYRKINGGVQFSNDGSVFEPQETPDTPTPPTPPTPTLDDQKENTIAKMYADQQRIIQGGINVTMTDGTVEHFGLSDHDQTNLMGLQTQVAQGLDKIPWHTSDAAVHCKYYSNADMLAIVTAAMQFVAFHVTYFRDLRIYISSMTETEALDMVEYGIHIPEEYQSEVLKDMYAAALRDMVTT